MATYTYEVDHGDESPAITAGMQINGGKLTAVQFDSALARLEKFEEALHEIAHMSEVYSADPSKWPASIAQAAIDNNS